MFIREGETLVIIERLHCGWCGAPAQLHGKKIYRRREGLEEHIVGIDGAAQKGQEIICSECGKFIAKWQEETEFRPTSKPEPARGGMPDPLSRGGYRLPRSLTKRTIRGSLVKVHGTEVATGKFEWGTRRGPPGKCSGRWQEISRELVDKEE